MVATAVEVQRLEGELQQCVAALQFEAAATLRDRLKALKAELAAGEAEVQRLEAKLQRRVEALEFEAAAQLRDRIKALRSSLGAASAPAGETTVQQDGRKLPEQTLGADQEQKDQPYDHTKTVAVLRLPVETTEAQLRAMFPKAKEIQLRVNRYNSHATALVEFGTASEAETLAEQGQLKVADTTVNVRMKEDAATWKRKREDEETRKVFVTQLPKSTRKADLQQHFPAAVQIALHRQNGKPYSYAFLLFPTVAEAEAAAARGKVQIGGKTGTLAMSAAKGNYKKDDTLRTVVLTCLPLKTSEAQLRLHFPAAETISLLPGKVWSTAFVVFATTDEARSVASQTRVEVAGCSVFAYLKGDKATTEESKKERCSRTVFCCNLPLTTDEEKVVQHFPSLEAVTLLPGKSYTAALVQFPTAAEAQSVASQGQITLEGRSISVCMSGSERCRTEEKDRTVYLAPLSPATTQAELEESFPTAESIRIVCKGSRTFAFVTFPDAEEALAVAQQAEMAVAGQTVTVCMDDPERGQKRPTTETPLAAKRSKLSPIGA